MPEQTPEGDMKLVLLRTANLAARINKMETGVENLVNAGSVSFEQFKAAITELRTDIDDLVAPKPDRAELYTALAKAQQEITNATANVDNEFTGKKYANLAAVLDAVRGPLANNGLVLIQLTDDPGEGVLGIRTILAHETGQTITDHITMAPPKTDPQGIGSCRTYMRRYSALAICCIAGAMDDDAEGTKQDPDDYERLTSTEVDKILHSADEMFGDRSDAVIAKMLDRIFGLTRLGDVKAGEFEVVINHLKGAAKLMAQAAKKGGKDKPKSPKPPENEEREPGSDDE